MKAWLAKYRVLLSIGLMLVLYAVGLVGLNGAHRDWFLSATPITLGMTLGLLLLNHEDWRPSFWIFMFATMLLGFGMEVLGVKTGLIFGEYAYGSSLGWKLFEVPLLIAGNWLLLTYSAGAVLARMKWHWLPKLLIAASLLCALDFLIEPVAMALDFWQWEGGIVPMRNYVAWWLLGAVMLGLFFGLKFEKHNKLAPAVLGLQLAFFGILYLMVN
jgi:putative membrane protein